MLRFTLLLILLMLPAVAMSQSETTTEETSLVDSSPQDNARSGAVRERSPGTWVRSAITRHNELMGTRLNGPRFGERNTEEAEARSGSGGGSSSSSGGFGSLADLLSLATQVSSGAGGLSGLGSLMGSPTGGTGTTTGTGTGGSTQIPPPSNGTEYTLADLIALGEKYGNQKSSDRAQSTNSSGYQFGGAIARLPKAEERFQSAETTTDEPTFRVRWMNAMLQTFFSAMTLGLQTPQFIEVLKDGLGPILFPVIDESTNGDGDGSGDGDNGSGGGIEDVDDDDDGGGGSTI